MNTETETCRQLGTANNSTLIIITAATHVEVDSRSSSRHTQATGTLVQRRLARHQELRKGRGGKAQTHSAETEVLTQNREKDREGTDTHQKAVGHDRPN